MDITSKSVKHFDGEMLKELRRRLRLTQAGIAKRLDVTDKAISREECGVYRIRLTLDQYVELQQLLDQAGMSIYDLTRKPKKPIDSQVDPSPAAD